MRFCFSPEVLKLSKVASASLKRRSTVLANTIQAAVEASPPKMARNTSADEPEPRHPPQPIATHSRLAQEPTPPRPHTPEPTDDLTSHPPRRPGRHVSWSLPRAVLPDDTTTTTATDTSTTSTTEVATTSDTAAQRSPSRSPSPESSLLLRQPVPLRIVNRTPTPPPRSTTPRTATPSPTFGVPLYRTWARTGSADTPTRIVPAGFEALPDPAGEPTTLVLPIRSRPLLHPHPPAASAHGDVREMGATWHAIRDDVQEAVLSGRERRKARAEFQESRARRKMIDDVELPVIR